MALFSKISNYASDAKTSLTSFATKAEVDLSNAKNDITTNISKLTDYADDKAHYVATQAGALGSDVYSGAADAFSLTPVGLLGYYATGTPNPGIAEIKGLGGKAYDEISSAIASNPTASSILGGIELGSEALVLGAIALGGFLLYETYQNRSTIYTVAKTGGQAALGIGLDFVPGGGAVKDIGQRTGAFQ